MPMMKPQVAVNGKQELRFASVQVKLKKPDRGLMQGRNYIKKDGITISYSRGSGAKFDAVFGSKDTRNEVSPIPMKEFYNNLFNWFGSTDHMMIKEKTTIIDPTSKMREINPNFEEVEKLLHYESKYGIRKTVLIDGVQYRSVAHLLNIIREELVKHGIDRTMLKFGKSVLSTDFVLGDVSRTKTVGWGSLVGDKRSAAATFNEITRNNWWQDMLVPHVATRMAVKDGKHVDACYYTLHKRKINLAIKPKEVIST